MHYAIHGHTAAELIVERADSTKKHMGLTTWQDAPDGKIKRSDVIIAKNYLTEFELSQLNRMVTSYLDFAENMANRKIPLQCRIGKHDLTHLLKCLNTGYFPMPEKFLRKLPSFMPKQNLKNIALFRTGCSCPTSINITAIPVS